MSQKENSNRNVIVHEGHESSVISVAFSPDGRSVLSGSQDCTVRLWDVTRPSSLRDPFEGHNQEVSSVSYSPFGHILASGSWDRTIRLWDLSTGQQINEPLSGHTNVVQSVDFSPTGKLIASGSYDQTIQLWHVPRGKPAGIPLKGHSDWVTSVAFSSDGARIVSGSRDKTIRIWDVERGESIIEPLEGHAESVTSVVFSPDGYQIASASYDCSVQIWDVRSGGIVNKLYQGHTDWVCSVAFSPNGTWVASGSDDQTVQIWDIRAGRPVREPFQGHTDWVNSVAFSPCGTRVASGSRDCKVMTWSVIGEDMNPDHVTNTVLDGDTELSPVESTEEIGRHMSIQEMFGRLIRHGCVNLASQMDIRQEGAIIVSGGGFGDIWMGKMYNGTRIAIKAWRASMIESCDYKTLKRATREIYFWSRLVHENIHQLMGVILFKGSYLGMVSEWMDNGNLHEFMRKNPSFDRYQVCVQVASGLAYMHECNTVHGDIKSLNVLVSSEGIAKLSDFGLSAMSEASLAFSNTTNTQPGSIRWAAPEQLLEEAPRTKSSDIYALGMTMLEIFTENVPYPECQKDFQVLMLVMQGTLPTRPKEHLRGNEKDNRMWDLLVNCWDHEATSRPSATKVLKLLQAIKDLPDHIPLFQSAS